MTPENFCYWLQGGLELMQAINPNFSLDANAKTCIQDHLNLVFKKKTPDRIQDLVARPLSDSRDFPSYHPMSNGNNSCLVNEKIAISC